MDEKKLEKLKTLLESEDFGEQMKTAETVEDFQALFSKNGVELTVDETDQILTEIAVSAAKGELDEKELNEVTGGSFLGAALIYAGGAVIVAGASWAAGRYLRNKSGVCKYNG